MEKRPAIASVEVMTMVEKTFTPSVGGGCGSPDRDDISGMKTAALRQRDAVLRNAFGLVSRRLNSVDEGCTRLVPGSLFLRTLP